MLAVPTRGRVFVNWEWRPAIIDWDACRAWAVLAPGEDWTEVDTAEVADSGSLIREDTFAANFEPLFGKLPPLPGGDRSA